VGGLDCAEVARWLVVLWWRFPCLASMVYMGRAWWFFLVARDVLL
jgi:hypothetical protein